MHSLLFVIIKFVHFYLCSSSLCIPLTALHAVEFQKRGLKRGLPHAHILAWLAGADREVNPTPIDSFISSEIPDPVSDHLGYALVSEFMMHGPCGNLNERCVYMKNGACSKHYLKKFQQETTIDANGFPIYRCLDNSRYNIKNGFRLDNRWVVPYNMPLLKKYKAHINIE